MAGPRNYFDRTIITDALVDILLEIDPVKVVTGDATGVDTIVAELISVTDIEYERYYADWDKYGKSAGPRRNQEMALKGTHLLAFYNGSAGTSNMIYFAKRHELIVNIIEI